jgi:hypothetical protein
MEDPIVECDACGKKNRIRPHPSNFSPICGFCGTALIPSGKDAQTIVPRPKKQPNSVLALSLLVLLGVMACGIFLTPTHLKRDFSDLLQDETRKTDEVRKRSEAQLASRSAALEAEILAINTDKLRLSAVEKYDAEFAARKSYDKRFALSAREMAQLKMQELGSDSSKSYHDGIQALAQLASPSGSDIDVSESPRGIALRIEFEMSSMTSGEHGTRTKHNTTDSLRKEVVSIVSRVTNDIFQSCKDLDLEAIYVGCRHLVQTEDQNGQTNEEITVLYKTRIQKSNIQELTNNPFLEVYSTSRYLEVEEDNFDTIEIITTQL